MWVNTREATGDELYIGFCMADGVKFDLIRRDDEDRLILIERHGDGGERVAYARLDPTIEEDAMWLVEQNRWDLTFSANGTAACAGYVGKDVGEAVMRCYVGSKLGDGFYFEVQEDETPLTIMGLVEVLQRLHLKHGDLTVVVDDDDTSQALLLKRKHISIGLGRLRIGACYGDEQDLT